MNLEKLYRQALSHREIHDCGASPYESYQKLYDLVLEYKPNNILEIGTGIGFSSVIMSLAAAKAHIDSIEKDPEHYQISKDFVESAGLNQKILLHNVVAEDFLPTLTTTYDLIFFDGFQIHYEFLPQYERLLKAGGVLILGNNHLASRTSTQFFHEFVKSEKWKILEQFADTTVAKRTTN